MQGAIMTSGTAESTVTGMPGVDDPARYDDVDLIIPVRDRRFIVPASDRSMVPHLLAYRCWEPHLTRYLTQELRPSHTFMDVGANFGYFSVLCAPLVDRVIAFEPATRTHRYCRANIDFNGLTNVELHCAGLWSEDAALHIASDSSGVNAVIARSADGAAVEPMQAVSLDGLIRSGHLTLSRLDVVKMDIEGAELAALAGMRETIARFGPAIVMEMNRPMLAAFGVTLEDVWDFFAGLSYDLRVFEHWQERDPVAAGSVDALRLLCPRDGLTDIVAVPRDAASTVN
jgi:FkbM family methyltransferase